jgi:histidyl-tRNA synthetase
VFRRVTGRGLDRADAVGAELAKLEKGREEHLQKQAEAQRAVPEAQLVDAVRAVLARHKLGPR